MRDITSSKGKRHGRHKEGNVLLGAVVEPHKKAIAIVTAAAMAGQGKPISQSDLIWEGIARLAMSVGVLDANGRVTPEYKDAVQLAIETVTATNTQNRGSRGGRRSK